MAAQYIFSMQGLSKTYPGGKKVFENIWLSFYPDAKIGVVGVNGSGKSTLLKIMAGLDRKSTRLNSSHANISYAVFCLKKKKTIQDITTITTTLMCTSC